MIKLLLVEDDANLRYVIQGGLEDIIGGYEVRTAATGEEGLRVWEEFKPDIIISDIDMPGMDGFEMVKRIREIDRETPVLFASALTSPKDVRKGYEMGVNNYIKTVHRRRTGCAHESHSEAERRGWQQNGNRFCRFGHYTLDTEHANLRDDRTGRHRVLTLMEAKILQILAQNKNEIIRREAILSRCWNTEDDYFASRSLDVFISKLRKLFEDDSDIEIKTIRCVGWVLYVH